MQFSLHDKPGEHAFSAASRTRISCGFSTGYRDPLQHKVMGPKVPLPAIGVCWLATLATPKSVQKAVAPLDRKI